MKHAIASAVLLAALTGPALPAARAQEPSPLTLSEAVGLTLESHPVMGQARARHSAASARTRKARSARLPSLATEASLSRFQEPMVVAPLHGFDPANPPTFDRNLMQGNISLGYTLFDGGARGARIEGTRAGEEAAAVGEDVSAMEMILGVSQAYLTVLARQELLRAAEGRIEALTSEEDRVRQFLDEGKAARVDLMRVRAALSRARAEAISAETGLDVAWGRLARLTGESSAALRRRSLVPVRMAAPSLSAPSRVLEAARAGSPDLTLARKELAAAEAGVRTADAAWLPEVRAAGRYADYGTLEGDHTLEWQASLSLSYPLFTGGARDAEEERARAERREAAEGVRAAELAVEEGVDEGLAALAEAQALREALELAAEQSEEVARIEALALDAGAGVQTDFLKAQADLFQTRAALVQARHGEIVTRLRLARVMGELTRNWIETRVEVER